MDYKNLLAPASIFQDFSGPPKHEVNPASWMYERIVRSIQEFEEELDDEHEVGARLVTFGVNFTMHIEDVGYYGPDIIKFYGRNEDGKPVELIQHMSQLSVLLVAVDKEGPEPRRIGFRLVERLESTDNDQGEGDDGDE